MNTDHSFNAIAVQGNYAYFCELIEMIETGEPQKIFVFDISRPASSDEAGKADTVLNTSDATCITVGGNYAYLGDEKNGLCIFDNSNPAYPAEIGSVSDVMLIQDLTVVGDKVLTANLGFMSVVDVTNLARPVLEDMYISSGLSWGIDVVGITIYLADYDGGLVVLNYSITVQDLH